MALGTSSDHSPPRYATLESARSIDRPSMGLLRRPTPGEIVEGGRLGRPCGPGALSRAISEKPTCGYAAILNLSLYHSLIPKRYSSSSTPARCQPNPVGHLASVFRERGWVGR